MRVWVWVWVWDKSTKSAEFCGYKLVFISGVHLPLGLKSCAGMQKIPVLRAQDGSTLRLMYN